MEAQTLQMERDSHRLREQQKSIMALRRTVVRESFIMGKQNPAVPAF